MPEISTAGIGDNKDTTIKPKGITNPVPTPINTPVEKPKRGRRRKVKK